MYTRCRNAFLVAAIRLPHQALGSIARHRSAHSPPGHEPRLAIELGGLKDDEDEERCAVGVALLIDTLEFGSKTDAFRRRESLVGAASNPVMGHETLGRKTCPALSPPPLENEAAALRLHARAKAVLFLFTPVVRLKSPFHEESPSIRR